VSTKPEYAKTWLLHHANEPVVDGSTWHSDQGKGRLFCRTLLPEDAVLEKVGGPGKEFLADGVNYAIDQGPSEAIRKRGDNTKPIKYDEVPELMGRWRMEVRPGEPRTEDVFLHLIQVGAQTLEEMCPATFDAGEGRVTVGFATTGPISGHIRIAAGGQEVVDRPLTTSVMPQSGITGSD